MTDKHHAAQQDEPSLNPRGDWDRVRLSTNGTLPAVIIKQVVEMKFALHCIEDGSNVEFSTEVEVWAHVRTAGLCAEEIYDDELPPRRILNPNYRIHTYDPDGELIAMARMRWTHISVDEW
jgi:hypothetical protein